MSDLTSCSLSATATMAPGGSSCIILERLASHANGIRQRNHARDRSRDDLANAITDN